MIDIASKINSFIAASNAYRVNCQDRTGEDVSTDDVQAALIDVLELGEPVDLLSQDWESTDVCKLLEGYDFGRLHPLVVDEVVLQDSIVPAGVPIDLVEETVRVLGERWVIHKNDSDPFPSNPHAHCFEKGLKLDLGSGILFRRRLPQGTIPWKSLLTLREQIRFRPLPELDKKARSAS